MKEPQDRYIARVCKPKKRQLHHKNHYSSDENEMTQLCRYCGYSREHTNIEDCPAYGKKCFKCQKQHHFAAVCKADRITDPAPKGKKKRHNRNNNDSDKKTDSSGSYNEEFISKSIAHMQVKTLKTVPTLEKQGAGHAELFCEEVTKLRLELD